MTERIDREAADIIASAILSTEVEDWFSEKTLRKLVAVQPHRDIWMKLVMHAKQCRVEGELNSMVNEASNLARMTEVKHWLDLPDLPDDLWLVDELIRRGSLSIVAGTPKAGKSTLIGDLVASLLKGSQFIDRSCVPTRCLYYSLEEIGAEVKQRFSQYGLTAKHPLFVREGYVPPGKFPFIMEDDIVKHSAEFILIDPLFDIIELESANDYVPVNRAIKDLLYLARKHNVHVCCIHHTAKQGGILGSQALKGGTDLNVYMEFNKQNDRVVYSECRYGRPLEKHLVKMRPDRTLRYEPALLD